eukprot:265299_1
MSDQGPLIPDESDDGSSESEEKDNQPRQNTFSYNVYDTKKILDRFGGDSNDINPEDFALDDEIVNPKIINKTKKIVIPLYIAIAVSAIIMMVTALVTDFVGAIIALICIITMTWVGSIIGMVGTYLWGSVEDAIDFFKKQNEKFEFNVKDLQKIRMEVREETKQLFFGVGKLNRTAKNLDSTIGEFDSLRQELGKVCGKNKKLNDMLDEINGQYNDLVSIIGANERAQLFSIYYEVSTKDKQQGLSQMEYERFLGRLNQSTKDFFEEQGTFHQLAGDDAIIDLTEFEQVLDVVIKKQEEEYLDAQFNMT